MKTLYLGWMVDPDNPEENPESCLVYMTRDAGEAFEWLEDMSFDIDFGYYITKERYNPDNKMFY